jgi:hypothetical protein
MADRNLKPDSGNDLVLEDAGSTDRLRITDGGSTILYEDGGAAALTIDTDGDVNLTQDIYLAAGKGIYFDGGTSSANYLGGSDAYEEGTFTLTHPPGDSGWTFTGSNAYYTRIGNLVMIQGNLAFSGVGTSNNALFPGLPFTAASTVAGSLLVDGLKAENKNTYNCQANGDQLRLYGHGETGALGILSYADVDTGTTFIYQCTYRV